MPLVVNKQYCPKLHLVGSLYVIYYVTTVFIHTVTVTMVTKLFCESQRDRNLLAVRCVFCLARYEDRKCVYLTMVSITTVRFCVQGHYSTRRDIDFSYNSLHSSPRPFCKVVAAILVCHEPGYTHFCLLHLMLRFYSPHFKKYGMFSFGSQTRVTSNKHVHCTLLFCKPSV